MQEEEKKGDSLEYVRWQDEIAMKKEIEALKQKIFRAAMYLAMIAQGTLLRPTRDIQLRGFIMNLYGDYFKYGVDRKKERWFEKQEMFLAFSCDETFRLITALPVGYKPLLEQWEGLTIMYDKVLVRKLKVEGVGAEVFRLSTMVSYVITHRSVCASFAHMLLDHVFMERVIGKQIQYPAIITAIFGAENKLLTFETEVQLIPAWSRLLKDVVLLQKAFELANKAVFL